MRSRLKTNVKKQSQHIIIGIIAIILILLLFGTQILIGFSTLIGALRGSDEQISETRNVDYVAPPILNPIDDATSKANIEISGYVTSSDVTISLFVNGEPTESTKPNSDRTFTFRNVVLKNGENEIKAKSEISDNKQSDFSNTIRIKYLNKEPSLEISSPSDGQMFKKDQSPIRISGKTDAGAKVTVNDFWAIMDDDGEFFYQYSLKDGDNTLKIIATDEAGNQTTKEIHIKVE